MVDAKYYQFLFLLVISIVTFAYSGKYRLYSDDRIIIASSKTYRDSGAILMLIFMTLFIGLRPDSYLFVDMMHYYNSYNLIEGSPFLFNPLSENVLFDNLFAFWGSAYWGFSNFMLLISVINFGCTYWACSRFFPNDKMVAFLVFLGAFSTFSYATNGVKAGAAAGVFLLALSYYNNRVIFILLLLLSYGFHHSMQLPLGACLLAYFYRNPKHYLYGWLLSILIAAAHITFFQELFASMSADTLNDEHGASYLQAIDTEWGGDAGFRIDLIAYSSMPVLVGYYAIMKKQLQVSKFYIYLLNVYLISNSVWMLCMYASFTNRIAYLSWLMYPVVLIYPFLREKWGANQYQTFSKIMLYHVGFTVFMTMIYYGGYKVLFR